MMDYITSTGFNHQHDKQHCCNQNHDHCHDYSDRNPYPDDNNVERCASSKQKPDVTKQHTFDEDNNLLNLNNSNDPDQGVDQNQIHIGTPSTSNNRIIVWLQRHYSTKMAIVISCVGVSCLTSVILLLVVPGSPFLFDDPSASETGPLRVASFNIRHFGKTLMSHDDIVSNIVKIFQRYDVVLVMEVRDSTHNALNILKSRLNSGGTSSWDYISSAPIGRTSYKEQYVFFYRPNSVKVISSYQVSDSATDVYEREPYAVEFEYISKMHSDAKTRIVFMGIHTKPTLALSELQALPNDVKKVASHYSDSMGVITMGDYNADCSYVNQKEQNALEIFHGQGFRSQIPDDADTTVSRNTDCAYDRIVVYGDKIDIRNSNVFNFESLLHMTKYEEANRISDHYPVEFLLY